MSVRQLPWFRVHNDILDHPKLLMLAPSDRWYFVSILSLKSQGVLDEFEGDKLDRVICAKLRLSALEWAECSRRLQEEELIDDQYQPVGWDKRQFKSDSSTDRVRKHRERKRGEARGSGGVTGGETLHETFQERDGNENVTPPDTDTETETDKPHSVRYRTASGTGVPVDNSMLAVGRDYRDQSAENLIFNRGVQFLTARGVAEKSARAFLGKCKADAGAGRTLDAVVTAILSQPEGDPKAYILGVLANPDRPMETTWEPDDATVAELQALEIPTNLIRQARDTFVTWFHHMEIYHSNWPKLFKRWVIRDWEAAEFDAFRFKRRLAQSSGFAQPAVFREPA